MLENLWLKKKLFEGPSSFYTKLKKQMAKEM